REQVRHDLNQPVAIDQHVAIVRRRIELDADTEVVRVRAVQVDRVLNDRQQRLRLQAHVQLAAFRALQIQNVVDQQDQSFAVQLRYVDQACCFGWQGAGDAARQ